MTGGTATYRDSFDRLADETVNWRPYVDYYDQLPRHVRGQKRYWMSCGYVIHFWMVEYQHADRVMRQFGRYQEIPPPPPLPFDEISYLREAWHHDGNATRDGCWKITHSEFIEKPAILIRERRPYDMGRHHMYMHWFNARGMRSVYLSDNNPEALRRQPPPRTEDVATMAYVPHGHRHSRVVRTLFIFSIKLDFSIIMCNMSQFEMCYADFSRDTIHYASNRYGEDTGTNGIWQADARACPCHYGGH